MTYFTALLVCAANADVVPIDDLAAAVAAAPAGAELRLAGRYTLSSTLVVDKSITLANKDNHSATIELASADGPVIRVQAGSLELRGLGVTGAIDGCGICVENEASLSLAGCAVTGNGMGGVDASDSAKVELAGCSLKDNVGFSVRAGDSASVELAGCNCSSTRPTAEGVAIGVALSGDAQAELAGCSVSHNGVGLWVGDCARAELAGCRFAHCDLGARFADRSRGSAAGCSVDGVQIDATANVEGLDRKTALFSGNLVKR